MFDTPRAVPIVDRTERHYATFLARLYRWMLGDFASALDRSRAELRELGVGKARQGARALDLGAGLGLQTLPLVELGYDVTAVDSSEMLLAELSAACPEARVARTDLAMMNEWVSGTYDVIVCMGDTLTHLRSDEEVRKVLGGASARLAPGGLLLLTFRDYTFPPPRPTDRFILVRGDAERILTCYLDYGADRVFVTDIVHELIEGRWSLRASQYEKLRLAASFVTSELAAHRLSVERCDLTGGRIAIVTRRALDRS